MSNLVKIDEEMRTWVSTDGHTHTHTHTRTDAKRLYYLSHAICYSYGADNIGAYSIIESEFGFILNLVSDSLGIHNDHSMLMDLLAGFTESESRFGFVIRMHFFTESETRLSVNPNPNIIIEYALKICIHNTYHMPCNLKHTCKVPPLWSETSRSVLLTVRPKCMLAA